MNSDTVKKVAGAIAIGGALTFGAMKLAQQSPPPPQQDQPAVRPTQPSSPCGFCSSACPEAC